MNIFVGILLAFALLGLIDRIIGNKMGLAVDFDMGLSNMGSLSVSVMGIYCVGVTLVSENIDAISRITAALPVDPSVLVGCILAPDLGGQPISMELAAAPGIGYFSGLVIAGCMGQMISFQLPVVYALIDERHKPVFMKGMIIGVTGIPLGLIVGGLILGLSVTEILINISIAIFFCGILMIGFMKAANVAERIMAGFGTLIKIGTQIMFALVIACIFIPGFQYVDMDLIYEVLVVLMKMVVVISGGLVLSKVCLSRFPKQLGWVASKLSVNEYTIMGLVLNCINSLAMLPLLHKMDETGQKMNGAFAVSGAYVLGGQLAFAASIAAAGNQVFYAFLAAKLIAGISVTALVWTMDRRPKSEK